VLCSISNYPVFAENFSDNVSKVVIKVGFSSDNSSDQFDAATVSAFAIGLFGLVLGANFTHTPQ
jgi:hypothetical protein